MLCGLFIASPSAAAPEQISHRVRRGISLESPRATCDFLALKLGSREFETFCCFFLDNRHHLIAAGGDVISFVERSSLRDFGPFCLPLRYLAGPGLTRDSPGSTNL